MNRSTPPSGRPRWPIATTAVAGWTFLLLLWATAMAAEKPVATTLSDLDLEQMTFHGVPRSDVATSERPTPDRRVDSILFEDDFEGDFPGEGPDARWSVVQIGVHWDTWDCWSVSGARSASGHAGWSDVCEEPYPSNFESQMVAGPFDLSAASIDGAWLHAQLNVNTEPVDDYLQMLVSIGGFDFYGVTYEGVFNGAETIDLFDVPGFGSMVGPDVPNSAYVYIGFRFFSDFENLNDPNTIIGGGQVDDVRLVVSTGSDNEAPTISLTSPVGGEVLMAGGTHTVTWVSDDPDTGPETLEVDISYSSDGGLAWTPVVSNLSDEGEYVWTVPEEETTNGRISVRVNDGENATTDISSANFTIAGQNPTITLTSPVGGEVLAAGEPHVVTWTASDLDDGPEPLQITIEYSSNGGGTWTTVAAGLENTGSYTWTVPEEETWTGLIRVRVYDGWATDTDQSGSDFVILDGILLGNILTAGEAGGASGSTLAVPLSLRTQDSVASLQCDLIFDPVVASFVGITTSGRGIGMFVESESIGSPRVRFSFFHEGEEYLLPGDGEIAQVMFNLVGPDHITGGLDLVNATAFGPTGEAVYLETVSGEIHVVPAEDLPQVQLAYYANPAQARALLLVVRVINGSGSAPLVVAGGSAVPMSVSIAGGNLYHAVFNAPEDVTEVLLTATDTNANGTGQNQILVTFP